MSRSSLPYWLFVLFSLSPCGARRNGGRLSRGGACDITKSKIIWTELLLRLAWDRWQQQVVGTALISVFDWSKLQQLTSAGQVIKPREELFICGCGEHEELF